MSTKIMSEELQNLLDSIKRIYEDVEKLVESSNNALKILEDEMNRLKNAGSMEGYKIVEAQYREARKNIKKKKTYLSSRLKSFEKTIKKNPIPSIRAIQLAELEKAKKTLKKLKI